MDYRQAMPPSNSSSSSMWLVIQLAFVGVAASLVYGFTLASREGESRRVCATTCLLKPQYVGANRKAPSFELRDANGRAVNLSDYKGKLVVLNFWSTTCEPCMKEMPMLADLASLLAAKKDAVLLTVSVDDDERDTVQKIRGILRSEPPFPILFDHGSKVVAGKFGTKLYPETWVIDKQGVVRARFDGARDWTDATILDYLDQIRAGDFCPVERNGEDWHGAAAAMCTAGPSGT